MPPNQHQPQKSKPDVNYVLTRTDAAERCGTCVMFNPAVLVQVGTCDLVKGIIYTGAVCDEWEVKP